MDKLGGDNFLLSNSERTYNSDGGRIKKRGAWPPRPLSYIYKKTFPPYWESKPYYSKITTRFRKFLPNMLAVPPKPTSSS